MKRVAMLMVCCAIVAQADELSDAYDTLKRAEAAQNGADVLKYATETSRLARIQIGQQVPPEARNDYQKERAIYLSQTDTYTEYSMAVAASYPNNSTAIIVQLTDAIIVQNPKSDYLALAVPPFLTALRKESLERQMEGAARIRTVQPANEDAVFALMEGCVEQQRNAEAARFAAELIAILTNKPRPEIYAEPYWLEKKRVLLERATAIISALSQTASPRP